MATYLRPSHHLSLYVCVIMQNECVPYELLSLLQEAMHARSISQQGMLQGAWLQGAGLQEVELQTVGPMHCT